MPIGKDIYKQISKKAGDRKARLDKFHYDRARESLGAVQPPIVENDKHCLVARASSHNLHILELSGSGPRRLSPNEGMPAVNGKSGDEVVEKAVTKVRPKQVELSPTAGAIKDPKAKGNKKTTSRKGKARLCGSCKQPGHTKRSCPDNA